MLFDEGEGVQAFLKRGSIASRFPLYYYSWIIPSLLLLRYPLSFLFHTRLLFFTLHKSNRHTVLFVVLGNNLNLLIKEDDFFAFLLLWLLLLLLLLNKFLKCHVCFFFFICLTSILCHHCFINIGVIFIFIYTLFSFPDESSCMIIVNHYDGSSYYMNRFTHFLAV